MDERTKTSYEVSPNRHEKIPQELIEEAKNLAITRSETMIIFADESIRDIKLDELLGCDKFYIDGCKHLMEMPSRKTYYDTATDTITNRHEVVVKFLESIGFLRNRWGFDPDEYDPFFSLDVEGQEHSYVSEYYPNVIIRVKPFY